MEDGPFFANIIPPVLTRVTSVSIYLKQVECGPEIFQTNIAASPCRYSFSVKIDVTFMSNLYLTTNHKEVRPIKGMLDSSPLFGFSLNARVELHRHKMCRVELRGKVFFFFKNFTYF